MSVGGTLNSSFSAMGLDKDMLGDLSDLTIIAEDFGESPDSDFAINLVEMGRKVIYQDDCIIRLGGVDKKPFEGRMYVLSDVIIVGKYKKSRKKSKKTMTTGKTVDKIVFGQDNIMTRDDMMDDYDNKTIASANTGTLRQDSRTLKLKLWVTLEGSGTQVRDIVKADSHGIKIIYTTKDIEEIDGEMEMVTNVDQTEVFFNTKDESKKFSQPIHDAIDDILERQLGDLDSISRNGSFMSLTPNDSMSATATLRAVEPIDVDGVGDDSRSVKSKSTLRTGRARAHMKGKATFKKQQRHRNSGKNAAPLTLADLESKYKVKLKPKAKADMAVFTVSFKQGSMGFALSSSGSHGVFIGKLEDNGMADVSGVTLGDRVVEIGGTIIPDEMSWKDCIEIIKKRRQDLDNHGKPKALIIKFARNREVEENIAKANEKKKHAIKKDRVKRAKNRKRDWKTKKDKHGAFGTRMNSLKDLENRYLNRGAAESTQTLCDNLFERLIEESSDKIEKKCAFVLREIYQTEKRYVSDLYMLKSNYIDRLTMKQVPMTCKESALTFNSKFCEHKVAVRNCKLESNRKKRMLSVEDKKALFMNVEVITQLNERLLKALQAGLIKLAEKAEKGKKVKVTDVLGVFSPAFLRLMPFYALYSQYAARYAKAMDRYQYLKETSEPFNEEIKTILNKKGVKTLSNLLITPITRLTKYPLLFKTLTEAMTPHLANLTKNIIDGKSGGGNIDDLIKLVDDLKETNSTVDKVAATVDFKVDEENKNDIMSEVFQELGGLRYIKEFFKPSRKFIERFEDISLQEKKKSKPERVILLFNDLFIVASYRKGSKKTLTTPGIRGTVKRIGKMSTISKDDSKTVLGTKGSGKGFFGMTKRGNTPLLKIEYMSEIKRLKATTISKKDAEGKVGAQCYLTIPVNKAEALKKTKKGKEANLDPGVSMIELYFPTEEARNNFVDNVKAEKGKLKDKEKGRKDAKVALTNARSHLKGARKRLLERAKKTGNLGASSQNRQADLKARMEEIKKKRTMKKP